MDWEITKIDVSERSRYSIQGINHCASSELDRRFYWSVDSVRDTRYFASKDIQVTPRAQALMERLGESIGMGE